MRAALAALSGLIALSCYIPYAVDIVRGRVRPARSARIMLLLLIVVALLQQQSLGSGFAIALTIGETIGSIAILFLALKYGVGGLRRLDLICYGLLGVDVLIWVTTRNAALALHLTILADCIAFWPTIHKTWQDPSSETPLFFWGAVAAGVLSVAAQAHVTYKVGLFPVYIVLVNIVELILIYRRKEIVQPA